MKCEALTLSGINLVKVEQDKLAYRTMKENGEFTTTSPEGKSKVDKRTHGKCTCDVKKLRNFTCPKLGTKKERTDEHMSDAERIEATYRPTPICHTVHKLYRESQKKVK